MTLQVTYHVSDEFENKGSPFGAIGSPGGHSPWAKGRSTALAQLLVAIDFFGFMPTKLLQRNFREATPAKG